VAWSNARPLLSLQGAAIYDAAVEDMESEKFPVSLDFVSGDFVEVFGIELLAGRELSDTDNGRKSSSSGLRRSSIGDSPTASVSSRRHHRASRQGRLSVEIVGVIEDVRIGKITDAIEPHMFVLASSGMVFTGSATFYVRSELPSDDVMSAIRDTVTRVDPTIRSRISADGAAIPRDYRSGALLRRNLGRVRRARDRVGRARSLRRCSRTPSRSARGDRFAHCARRAGGPHRQMVLRQVAGWR